MTTGYRAALLADKAPYLLTLFLAASGWLVTYTVGRYEKAPLVEYSTSVDGRDAGGAAATAFVTTVRNVSPSGLIACVRLRFTARDQTGSVLPLTRGEIVRISGPMTDVVFSDVEQMVDFQMDLHPAAAVEVPLTPSGLATLGIVLKPCELPTGMLASGPLPVLMEASCKTALIRYSLEILWLGLVLLALALGCIYWTLGRAATGPAAAVRPKPVGGSGSGPTADPRPTSTNSGGICP